MKRNPTSNATRRRKKHRKATTPVEQLVAGLIKRLEWENSHPTKAMRDYQRALRAHERAYDKEVSAERAAWESDFPNIPYDHVTTCLADHYPQEFALFVAWSRGRTSAERAKATRKVVA